MYPRTRLLCLTLVMLTLVLAAPAGAQDDAPPDPFDLAQRLLHYEGEIAIPPPARAYQIGDKDTFWVSKAGQDTPVQVTATLAAQTFNLYIWVEDGIPYDPEALGSMAGQVGAMLEIIRVDANHPQVQLIPQSQSDINGLSTLRLPDIDNDPHLYVLYTRDLADTRNTLYNQANSFPAAWTPGGYSNQHEMVFVNTTNFPNLTLDHGTYFNLLARQFYDMFAAYNNPAQAPWLSEALSWYMLLGARGVDIQAGDIKTFLDSPDTPLIRIPGLTTTGSELGAQQLFLRYVLQRFGDNVLRGMATGSGSGMTALDDALAANHITDLVTGEPLSGNAVFADFVMTNVLNVPFGDGRYVYTDPVAQNQRAVSDALQNNFNVDVPDQVINQYGTRYIALTTDEPASFSIAFEGQNVLRRLPMPTDDMDNRFYWSGGNADGTMTREFDLSNTTAPTLTFDAWYALATAQNYAYVEVSADGGTTWDILPTSDGTTSNPYALNYGTGFTGISNPKKPRPFPFLGVEFDPASLTITNIAPDGPVANTEAQAGDILAGVDSQPWTEQPNLLALLGNYEPGDTLNLYIQRGDEFLDVPVVLSAHPSRRVVPEALWMPQTVDLSAYAGQNILLRFELLRQFRTEDSGVAIDNIRISDIGFADDAESSVPGWTLNGWEQMNNQAPGQYLLQSAHLTDTQTRVQHLIGPNDMATNGVWNFTLAADDVLVLAISGVSEQTTLPAIYNLRVRPAETSTATQ